MLYIFAGLPGAGKTEIARKAAERLGAFVLNEDEVLRELFSKPEYTWDERDQVYGEMFQRAEKLLAEGKDLILDATFIFEKHRKGAKNLARKYDAAYLLIEITADEENIRKRLEARPDDVDFEIYLKYKQNQEPLQEQHIVIENNGDIDEAADKVLSLAADYS